MFLSSSTNVLLNLLCLWIYISATNVLLNLLCLWIYISATNVPLNLLCLWIYISATNVLHWPENACGWQSCLYIHDQHWRASGYTAPVSMRSVVCLAAKTGCLLMRRQSNCRSDISALSPFLMFPCYRCRTVRFR